MVSANLARVFVTGGQGFLGAAVLKELLGKGSEVALFDVKEDQGILKQVLSPSELGRVAATYYGDIADAKAVTAAVLKFRPTAIIHLAGVQIPTVRANPLVGVSANVVGTINIFEASKALAVQEGGKPVPIAYASSGAVLGPSSDYNYNSKLHAELDYHKPRTLYGVFKLCNEGTARIYWQDYGIPSVGLRPLTVFGVGREVGLTSGPTKAVKAAVLGRPFELEVTGVTGFHYVDDVAHFFVECLDGTAKYPDAHVSGIKGHVVSYEDFLKEAAKSIPDVARLASIKKNAPEVPIHGDVDESVLLRLLQPYTPEKHSHRPLAEAIADMAKRFKDLHSRGELHDRDLGPPPPPRSKL